jgi:hypothetical protein
METGFVVPVPVDPGVKDLVTERIGLVEDPFQLGGSVFPQEILLNCQPGRAAGLLAPILGQDGVGAGQCASEQEHAGDLPKFC